MHVYIHAYTHTHTHTHTHTYRSLSTTLINTWERAIKNEMVKLENISKWNGSTEYEIEKAKQTR